MSDTTATSSLTEVADELDSDDSNSTCLSHSSSSPVKQKPSAGQCFHGVGCTQGVMPPLFLTRNPIFQIYKARVTSASGILRILLGKMKNYFFNSKLNVISSDPTVIEWHVRYTTVPLKAV